MPHLRETAAGVYALAVYNVLVEEFPRLKRNALKLIVVENVARQAEIASMGFESRGFELVVDEPTVANWRLIPDHVGDDRWRVQLACCKPRPSHANSEREQRINAALRAIQMEA